MKFSSPNKEIVFSLLLKCAHSRDDVRIDTLESEYSCNLGCTASRKINKLDLHGGKGLELSREQIDYMYTFFWPDI
jgi:hypothetical protein